MQSPLSQQHQPKKYLCTHIKTLTKKQVTSIVEFPAEHTCPTHQKNIQSPILCLHCNKVFCGIQSKEKCISTHQSLNQGHIFSLNLQAGNVYCATCDSDLSERCQLIRKKAQQSEEQKKLQRFVAFVSQNYQKLKIIHQQQRLISSSLNCRGIENLGNTCFLNVCLQSLNHSSSLVSLYQQYTFVSSFSKSISYSKKSLPKEVQFFYDDAIQEGESKEWHYVAAKKPNSQRQSNQKLMKTVTGCKFVELMKKFFEEMSINKEDSQKEPYEPFEILDYLASIDGKYREKEEQDAEEALLFMIDVLVQGELVTMGYDLERYQKVQRHIGRQKISPTQRLFGFYLMSQVFCQNCKKITYRSDLTYHLALDITSPSHISHQSLQHHLSKSMQPNQLIYHKFLHYPETSQKISLHEFLHSFFSEQRLTQRQNYYTCSNCKSLVGLKKFYLLDLPQILIISIKRFGHKLTKNQKHVKFQDKIDLKDVTLATTDQQDDENIQKQQTVYRLYAVIVHQGQTIHGGHYICFVKSKEGVWLKCSDHQVTKTTYNEVSQQQAYVLLYEKIHE